MVRAIVGSGLGSGLTMFLFLREPQVFQQGIAPDKRRRNA